MVSFFGLKVGGKKKKAENKQATKEPERPKRIDQNTLGEGQFFGVNTDQKSVFNEGSIRSVSRAGAGTPQAGVRGPYTETHNLAAVSMFDLGTASRSGSQASFRPDLKTHASDMNLGGRFGATNGSSASLALPPNFSSGPPSRMGSRPGTPSGRTKAWVNPLDVHFARGAPTAPTPLKIHPLAQSSIELPPPTPTKSDAGSVFGEEADDMVDAVMASVKRQEEESAKEKEKKRELEKKKETARLELERLERQKSNESMLPKSPVERQHQLSFFDRPQNSPTLPGPMFRGNVDQRPSSRGGLRQDSPISPTGGQSPTIHQGPPPTGPPTQCLPQPPGQGPRQRPRGPNEARGPQQTNTPPYSPNHSPTEASRGGFPMKAGQGPNQNGPSQGPRSSPPGPRNEPAPQRHLQHSGPQSPHLHGPQQRNSPPINAGPYRPPPGPRNGPPGAGPRGPPGAGPRGPGFHGPRSESPMRRPMAPGHFRSESPARRPMGNGGRSESPGPRFMGNNGPRSESPGPRFRGNNEFRSESPRRMPGNNGLGPHQLTSGMSPRPGPGPVPRPQVNTTFASRPQANATVVSSPQVDAAPELPTPITEVRRSPPLIATLTSPTPSTARSSVGDEFLDQLATPPVIRDVSAKRNTLTAIHHTEQSLSMKIEELEKTILSQHVLKPRPTNLAPAPINHRISTASSCYSSDMPDMKDDEDDNDEPILSIQPAPLRIPSPLPPSVAAAVTSPVRSPGSPIRAPKLGQRPRRPGLDEYGVSSGQLSSPRARAPTPASATLTSPTDNNSILSFHTANNSPPSRSTTPLKTKPSLPILAPTTTTSTAIVSPVEPLKPIPFIDTGFQFDFGTTIAGPLTPDSSHWHLSSPTTESAFAPGVAIASPPSAVLSEPSPSEEGIDLPKFTRPNVPPPLKLKFNFSPEASSRDPTFGTLTPPLHSAPPMIAVNDGRPSTSAGYNNNNTFLNGGLQASPQLISQFPEEVKDENRLSFMGIGVARGPSIREVRRPGTSHGTGQGQHRMVDSFGTGFI
ncbi:hypothetical protein QBC41DRAFT_59978 [Cercophora samala]|uniref:Uncharacterized protein n=1 Tax=Cercophora samala TaxID=330535 RepID=A0AA39ZHL6_9PEZI|nr:hypothetical protein QBC41DRAFT_59978 [Cercophora samala]